MPKRLPPLGQMIRNQKRGSILLGMDETEFSLKGELEALLALAKQAVDTGDWTGVFEIAERLQLLVDVVE